jgi:hypothetical protein
MPHIITIPTLAKATGYDRKTIYTWVQTVPVWRACVSHKSGRRTYMSVERLRAAGLLGAA